MHCWGCVCGSSAGKYAARARRRRRDLCACAVPVFPNVRRKSARARSTRVRALVQCAEHEKTPVEHQVGVLVQCVAGMALCLRAVCAYLRRSSSVYRVAQVREGVTKSPCCNMACNNDCGCRRWCKEEPMKPMVTKECTMGLQCCNNGVQQKCR